MRSRLASILVLALTLSLPAPAPVQAQDRGSFLSALGSQAIRIAKGLQRILSGAGAETTPAEATEAGERFGAELGREVHGVALALQSTAKDLKNKGIDRGALERELKSLEPMLRRIEALSKRAQQENETTGSLSPQTAQEIQALKNEIKPQLEATGKRLASHMEEAVETFKNKFSEEDITRMKRGVEKVSGFLEGFAEGFKKFMQDQGHALEASPPR